MPLEVRKDEHRSVVFQMFPDDVFLQVEAVAHGNEHVVELVHDVAGGNGLEAVVFNGLPVIFGIQPFSAVGGAAFHDGSVQLPDQRRDEGRLQEMMSAGFARGNFHRNVALQRMSQSFIELDQAFRRDGAGEIHLRRFRCPGGGSGMCLVPVRGHAVESDASHGQSTRFQERPSGKIRLFAHDCLLGSGEPCRSDVVSGRTRPAHDFRVIV